MRDRTVKRIFIFFLIFLPLQYGVVGITSMINTEPWPALVLPAFKTVFGNEDRIIVPRLELYVENNKKESGIEIRPEALFKGIEKSQLQGFYRTHLQDSAAAARWNGATRRWIRLKLEENSPVARAERLRVRWVQQAYALSLDDTLPEERHIRNQFVIDLNSE